MQGFGIHYYTMIQKRPFPVRYHLLSFSVAIFLKAVYLYKGSTRGSYTFGIPLFPSWMEGVVPNTDRSLLLLFLNALTASTLLSPRDPHYMWIYIGEGGGRRGPLTSCIIQTHTHPFSPAPILDGTQQDVWGRGDVSSFGENFAIFRHDSAKNIYIPLCQNWGKDCPRMVYLCSFFGEGKEYSACVLAFCAELRKEEGTQLHRS